MIVEKEQLESYRPVDISKFFGIDQRAAAYSKKNWREQRGKKKGKLYDWEIKCMAYQYFLENK